MRNISTEQDELLTRQEYHTAVSVQIEDMDGVLQDLTNFEGRNWVKSFTVTRSADNESTNARIVFHSKEFLLNLAPLDAASKLNLDSGGSPGLLLDVSRDLIIRTRNLPLGITAVTFVDDDKVFEGKTGRLSEQSGLEGSELVMEGRGGQNEHTIFIENVESYGSSTDSDHVIAGGNVEDIMQDILDNWTPGPTTLFTPTTPGFVIPGPWEVSKQNVLAACRQAAGAIGWECRYRWRQSAGEYQLTLYEPDRTPSSLRTFALGEIIRFNNFQRNSDDIRNKITVSFYTDPTDITTLQEVTVSDATSIALYGLRWAGIAEAQSSPINTLTEATRLANAALADMKDPDLIGSVILRYFPFSELGDYYTFPADKIHFSTSQLLAVQSVKLSVDVASGRSETEFGFQIKPSMGRLWWRRRFQIPGIGDVIRDKIPLTPVATLDVLDHGIQIQWDDPIDIPVHYFEVHQSLTAAFTPGPSTLVQRTQANRYRRNGLDQETPYFFRILAVDKWGNVSSSSNEVTSIPGYLRGFPGRIETTRPAATALQPGQMVFMQDGSFSQRKYQTYVERILNLKATEPLFTWGLDETSGTNAADDSSNGNDGTYTNTGNIGLGEPPAIEDDGKSAQFRATNGHVQLVGKAITGVTSFSAAVWFKRESTNPAAVTGLWLVRAPATSFEIGVRWLGVSPFDLEIFINNFNAALTGKIPISGLEMEERSWVQMVVTWDNTAGDLKVYLNDVEQDSLSGIQTGVTLDLDDFFLGAEDTANAVQARLDRATFWTNEVLTLAEVKELYYNGRAVDTNFDEARIESGGGFGSDQSRHLPFFVVELTQDINYTFSGWANTAFGRVLSDPWQMFIKQLATTVSAAAQGSAPVTIPLGWEGYWQFGARVEAINFNANQFLIVGIAIDEQGTGFPGGSGGNPQNWSGYAGTSPGGIIGGEVVTKPIFMAAGGQAKVKHFSNNDSNYNIDQRTTDATLTYFWGRYLFQKRNLDRGTV